MHAFQHHGEIEVQMRGLSTLADLIITYWLSASIIFTRLAFHS